MINNSKKIFITIFTLIHCLWTWANAYCAYQVKGACI